MNSYIDPAPRDHRRTLEPDVLRLVGSSLVRSGLKPHIPLEQASLRGG
jgi:hypothetical protein